MKASLFCFCYLLFFSYCRTIRQINFYGLYTGIIFSSFPILNEFCSSFLKRFNYKFCCAIS